MISQNTDRSDVYCSSFMKGVLERVWSEIHANSVFSRIIDEYNPRGVNQGSGFGRVSTKKLRTWSSKKTTDSVDNVNCFSRVLDAGDGIKYRVSIERRSQYIGTNGYQFTDDFNLKFEIMDTVLANTYYIKSDFTRLRFESNWMAYKQGDDFRHFCISMVQEFNAPNKAGVIQKRFSDRKTHYQKLHAATGRFP